MENSERKVIIVTGSSSGIGAEVARLAARNGYNVVVHEMAHKLDMQNGDANGFPPLHSGMCPSAWYDAFGIKEDAPLYLKPEDRVRIW